MTDQELIKEARSPMAWTASRDYLKRLSARLADRLEALTSQPDPLELCRELRGALGMPCTALPYSPRQAWDEAIAEAKALNPKEGEE